jgi:hypothetical protein
VLCFDFHFNFDRFKNKMPNSKYTHLLMNLLPIFGAVFWGWTPFSVIFVYWLESLSITVFTSLKILISKGDGNTALNTFQSMGFGLKYTGLLFFYLLFIVVFVGATLEVISKVGLADGTMEFHLEELEFTQYLFFQEPSFRYSMLGFLLFKLIYFFGVFVKEKQYLETTIDVLKKEMMSRVITKHLVIILGFFAAVLLTSWLEMNVVSITFACVFVLIKSLVDFFSKKQQRDEVQRMFSGIRIVAIK